MLFRRSTLSLEIISIAILNGSRSILPASKPVRRTRLNVGAGASFSFHHGKEAYLAEHGLKQKVVVVVRVKNFKDLIIRPAYLMFLLIVGWFVSLLLLSCLYAHSSAILCCLRLCQCSGWTTALSMLARRDARDYESLFKAVFDWWIRGSFFGCEMKNWLTVCIKIKQQWSDSFMEQSKKIFCHFIWKWLSGFGSLHIESKLVFQQPAEGWRLQQTITQLVLETEEQDPWS